MPSFVSGTINLLQAVNGWLLALIPIAAGLMLGYHGLMKTAAAGDYGAIDAHNRAMKNIVTAAIVAESAMAIIRAVLSYY